MCCEDYAESLAIVCAKAGAALDPFEVLMPEEVKDLFRRRPRVPRPVLVKGIRVTRISSPSGGAQETVCLSMSGCATSSRHSMATKLLPNKPRDRCAKP